MLNSGIKLYFGDATDHITKEYEKSLPQLKKISEKLGLKGLYAARQVHGIKSGIVDASDETIAIFDQEVDSLITDQVGIGIGVFTADCLPVLLYEPEKRVVAAVHVGWRGAARGILQEIIKTLKQKYQINPAKLEIFFGPAIKLCCYEVGKEVVDAIEKTGFSKLSLYEQEEQTFFDQLEFAKQVLLSEGCRFNKMDQKNSLCTRCIKTYYSYRRDNATTGRQINIIALQ